MLPPSAVRSPPRPAPPTSARLSSSYCMFGIGFSLLTKSSAFPSPTRRQRSPCCHPPPRRRRPPSGSGRRRPGPGWPETTRRPAPRRPCPRRPWPSRSRPAAWAPHRASSAVGFPRNISLVVASADVGRQPAPPWACAVPPGRRARCCVRCVARGPWRQAEEGWLPCPPTNIREGVGRRPEVPVPTWCT